MIAPEVTLIRAAATVVAWGAGAKAHVYMPNAAAQALQEAQARIKDNVPELDWNHRSTDTISPLIPTGRTFDSSQDGRPVGISLISRAYQSLIGATGMTYRTV